MHHGPHLSPDRRAELASAFAAEAEEYDAVRPGYPREIVEACTAGLAEHFPVIRAVDLGAGSGIFTAQLQEHLAGSLPAGQDSAGTVVAVDISEEMLSRARKRGLETRLAPAENTGLPAQSWELATCAQAWHWLNPQAAGVEAARLVRPRGRLALAWNQLDVTVPWVHRLSRIMRSGDVFYTPETPPRPGGRWRSPELTTARFDQPLTPEQVVELAKSRASYRKADAVQRERIERQTLWYLTEELAHAPEAPLALPYLSFVWTFVRSSRVD